MRHVEDQLPALAEGRLGNGERHRVLEHLGACRRCRRYWDDVRAAHRAMQALQPTRLPAEQAAHIRAALRRRAAVPEPARLLLPFGWWRWASPVAAALIVTVGIVMTSGIHATQEWPQWRGPARDGKSPARDLLPSWPDDGPAMVWQAVGIGGGYASVAVAGGRIFTMGDLDDGQYAIALDRDDGRHLWRTRVGSTWRGTYLGPRATPTIDDGRVYVMSTGGVVTCLDATTGARRWSRDLPAEYGATIMKRRDGRDWRFSESPLVDGDRVIVTPGVRGAALVAFDKTTGREIWRARLPRMGESGAEGAGYASAVISEGGGVRQYVQLLGRGLIGVEAETGRVLWGYNRIANDIANISTPIVDGDLVFASTGFGTGSVLLRLERQGGGSVAAREVYFLDSRVMENQLGGMILHDGYIYAGTGLKGRPMCLELTTGEVAWGPRRNAGGSSTVVTFADGHLYFRYEDGRMILVDASPDDYRERGTFMIPRVHRASWTQPVIAGGTLYLREHDRLFAYDVSG